MAILNKTNIVLYYIYMRQQQQQQQHFLPTRVPNVRKQPNLPNHAKHVHFPPTPAWDDIAR